MKSSASVVKGVKKTAPSPGEAWRPPDQAPNHRVKNKNDKSEDVDDCETVQRTIVAQIGTEKLVQIKCSVGNEEVVATIDGGSQLNLITLELAQKLNLDLSRHSPATSDVRDVQGQPLQLFGEVNLCLTIGQKRYSEMYTVTSSLPSSVLIGRPFLKRNKVIIDHGQDIVMIGRCRVDCIGVTGDSSLPSVVACQRKRIRLPPNCVFRVAFTSCGPVAPNVIYEARGGLATANVALVPELITLDDKTACVEILNLSDRHITMKDEKILLVPLNMAKYTTCSILTPLSPEEEIVCGNVQVKKDTLNAGRRRDIPANETEEEIQKILDQVKIGKCSSETKKRVKDLLRKYHTLFSRHKWDIGRVELDGFSHKIRLKPGAVPRRFAHYRVAQAEMEVVKKFIDKMKGADLIKESTSEWAMPMMLLQKPDDPRERRPVVNCKYLNEMQECQATFLPRIDDLLDRFSSKKRYLSKLDCTQFFFQIPLDEDSKQYCSFSTPIGNWSSNVMLQGDANAPQEAQRLLMHVLRDIEDAFCLIDDIGLAHEELEQHLLDLEEIFKRLLAIGVTLRPDKIEILSEKLDYLGYTILAGGTMKITDEKVEAVRNWPRPRTVAEVRSFIGFASFVRRFVCGFSEIARPLLDLMKQDKMAKSDWTRECEVSFRNLKHAITSEPCLIVPDPQNGTMHLFTDASEHSLGYVLACELDDEKTGRKVLKPCGYGSRLFRGSEKNYSITEKEIVAAVWSIRKNRPYLYGQTFRLHTDNESVYHVLKRTNPDMASRLSRFAFDVIDYHFHTHHVRSEKNWADGLSRLPVVKDKETGELAVRTDEEIIEDPYPPTLSAASKDPDPLWTAALTRGQVVDASVGPGLREEQKKDVVVAELRKKIEQTPKGKLKKGWFTYFLHKDVVMLRDRRRRVRYVVPASMVKALLVEEHTAGHLGKDKMQRSMGSRFHWAKMHEDIEAFVRSCFTCQTCKRPIEHEKVPLGSLPRPTKPQDVLAMDVKGPLPMSDRNVYIIVAVDLFTRFAWTKAVNHVDGMAVANFLVNSVFPFGVPSTIITDNANNLKKGVAGHLYPMLGIIPRNSVPLFAQSNGGVERLIGTFGSMLRCATEENPRTWSSMVQPLTTDYNQSVHRATLMKPFLLHFGYDPKAISIEEDGDEYAGPRTTPQKYLDELRRRQKSVKKAVKEGLDRYYENMSEDYLARTKTRPHEFYVGQLVLAKRLSQKTGESKSLGPLYLGPAEVTKVTDTTAEIVFLNTNSKKLRSVTQLKPYYEDSRFPTDPGRFTGLRGGTKKDEDDEPQELGEDVVRGRENPTPDPPKAKDPTAGPSRVVDPKDDEEDVSQTLDEDEDDGDDVQESSGNQEGDVQQEEEGGALDLREEQNSLPSVEDRRVRFSSPIADVVNTD